MQDVASYHHTAVHKIIALNETFSYLAVFRLKFNDGLIMTRFVDLVCIASHKRVIWIRLKKPDLRLKAMGDRDVIRIHDGNVFTLGGVESSIP